MAKPLPPAPVDNDPDTAKVPKEQKEKLGAYISNNTWGQMKTWFKLLQSILKGVTNDGTTITFPENVVINGNETVNGNVSISGSINGMPSTPGMADRDGEDTVVVFNSTMVNSYQSISVGSTAIASVTPTIITSLLLNTGIWDISGTVSFIDTGSTVTNALIAGISTATSFINTGNYTLLQGTFVAAGQNTIPTPVVRVTIGAPTVFNLVGQINFTGGTAATTGLLRANPAGG